MAGLTKQKIVDKALKLADQHGLDKLSMRKLADALNVKAMSLYNHIQNKEALLDALVEAVVAKMHWQDQGNWYDSMMQRGQLAHDVLMSHPWAAHPLVSRINTGDERLLYVNNTIGALVDAGFDYATADHAWNAMDSFIYGYTQQAINFPFAPEEYAQSAKEYVHMIPKERLPYLHQMTVEVMEQRYSGINEFEWGFKLVLDGIQKRWQESQR